MALAAPLRPLWWPYQRAGYALIALTFGVLGGGACFVRIDSAVVAPATLEVVSSRKVIGHLEGGIVSDLMVHEGDSVPAGTVLLQLNDVAARSSVALLTNQLFAAVAMKARLVAEQTQVGKITWPAELLLPGQPAATAAISDESATFSARQRSLEGQLKILRSRATQSGTEALALLQQQRSDEAQLRLISSELATVSNLYALKLVPAARMLALQREQARLGGEVGHASAEWRKNVNQASEFLLQADHANQQFVEDASAGLARVSEQIGEMRSKLEAAQDVLTRTTIRAPIAGSVQELRVGGAGQVIREGEPLMGLVPQDDQLRIDAHIQPEDISDLHAGQVAEVRFPALPGRRMPIITGKVVSVSGDRIVDSLTHEPYYLAIVTVQQPDLPPGVASRLRPGMPAEVIVTRGERTVMSFLTDPLAASARHTFVEH